MTPSIHMRVSNIIYNGNLLINVSENLGSYVPSPGDMVVDLNGNKIGVVQEIIGPVKSPFIVVKPYDRSISRPDIVGTEVRITENKKRGDIHGRRMGGRRGKKGGRNRKMSRVRKYSHNKRL